MLTVEDTTALIDSLRFLRLRMLRAIDRGQYDSMNVKVWYDETMHMVDMLEGHKRSLMGEDDTPGYYTPWVPKSDSK